MKIDAAESKVKTFLVSFIDYITAVRSEENIHVTRLNDWVVKPVTSQSREYYHIYFRKESEGETSVRYAFYLYEGKNMPLGKGLVAITKFDDEELSGIHNSKTEELAPNNTFSCFR